MINSEWGSDGVWGGGGETLVQGEYDQLVTSASTAVIEAIASVEDVEPIELSTRGGITLHDYVDPDALNRLFADGCANDFSITFLVDEYRVWIESNEVAITDTGTTSAGPSDTDR